MLRKDGGVMRNTGAETVRNVNLGFKRSLLTTREASGKQTKTPWFQLWLPLFNHAILACRCGVVLSSVVLELVCFCLVESCN